MTTHVCDCCGQLIQEGALRYIAKIRVYAAPDLLKISLDDLLNDHTAEIDRLLEQCEGLTEAELMKDIYVDFQFNLCRACQKAYVANPLPPGTRAGRGQ